MLFHFPDECGEALRLNRTQIHRPHPCILGLFSEALALCFGPGGGVQGVGGRLLAPDEAGVGGVSGPLPEDLTLLFVLRHGGESAHLRLPCCQPSGPGAWCVQRVACPRALARV